MIIPRTKIHPDVITALDRLNGLGFQAYLVGGAVRDLLMFGECRPAVGSVLDTLLEMVLEDPSLNTREALKNIVVVDFAGARTVGTTGARSKNMPTWAALN